MSLIVLLGRFFYSLLFIFASFGHFSESTIAYAAARGVPFPAILVPLSGIIALLGGLSILLGFRARCGAWLIVLFLVPVTLMMHRFWSAPPDATQLQLIMFNKNLALLGGALLITYFGSGPYSLDRCCGCCKKDASCSKE